MAATFGSSSTVVGLGSNAVSSPTRISSSLGSGFVKSRVAARNPMRQKGAEGGRFMCFERDWLRKDLNVIGFGLIGWIAPSSLRRSTGRA
ncbi:hypothetical protein MANES_11G164551v8 [Manihot esculenta]|uniref:Uncharacterized protein n=1 Tax=Manihot esculenta TaxID=3983 RepID=A0ACB7GYG7_MANES|nr:hypothetical protein MANES_11G164551v8 [Manihot esculenta]